MPPYFLDQHCTRWECINLLEGQTSLLSLYRELRLSIPGAFFMQCLWLNHYRKDWSEYGKKRWEPVETKVFLSILSFWHWNFRQSRTQNRPQKVPPPKGWKKAWKRAAESLHFPQSSGSCCWESGMGGGVGGCVPPMVIENRLAISRTWLQKRDNTDFLATCLQELLWAARGKGRSAHSNFLALANRHHFLLKREQHMMGTHNPAITTWTPQPPDTLLNTLLCLLVH